MVLDSDTLAAVTGAFPSVTEGDVKLNIED